MTGQRITDAWRRGVRDSRERGMTSPTKLVLLTMSTYANADGTNIYPGLDVLAQDTGLHKRTVQDALAVATRLGLLILVRRGGGRGIGARASEYRLAIPQNWCALDSPVLETGAGTGAGTHAGTHAGTGAGTGESRTHPPKGPSNQGTKNQNPLPGQGERSRSSSWLESEISRTADAMEGVDRPPMRDHAQPADTDRVFTDHLREFSDLARDRLLGLDLDDPAQVEAFRAALARRGWPDIRSEIERVEFADPFVPCVYALAWLSEYGQ